MSRPRSKDEIVQLLAREFEAESKQIERDLEAFLVEMESVGLVNEVGVAASS